MTTMFDTLPLLDNDQFVLRRALGQQPIYLLRDMSSEETYEFHARTLRSEAKCSGTPEFSILYGRIEAPEPFTLFFVVQYPNAEQAPEICDNRRVAHGELKDALRYFHKLLPSERWALFGL